MRKSILMLMAAVFAAGCFDHKGAPADVPTVKSAAELAACTNSAALVRVILRNSEKLPSLASLDAARVLDISECGLTSLPDDVFKLSKLEHLYCAHNQLRDIPAGIFELKDLTYLNLDGNHIESVPDSIGGLEKLRWLRLNENRITSLPSELSKCSGLQRIYLRGNRLSKVPEVLKELRKLEDVALDGNPEIAEVPEWMTALPELRNVSFAFTKVAKLPDDLSGWRHLSTLTLTDCPLSTEEMKRVRAALPDVSLIF